MIRIKFPEATIARLSLYSRYLNGIKHNGIETISSGEIANGVGVKPPQVRKDLAIFGEFGTRGVGYNVDELHKELLSVLNLDSVWNVALVGMGHLGQALASYKNFIQRNFTFTSFFDNDLQKIGMKVDGTEILPVERLEEIVAQKQIKIGIITVPSEPAQEIANSLIRAGIKAILNFAPVHLVVPPKIKIRNVDLAGNLELISFNLQEKHTLSRKI